MVVASLHCKNKATGLKTNINTLQLNISQSKKYYTTYLLKCRTNNNTRLYPIVQSLAKQQYLSTPFIRKRVGDIYSNQYEMTVF